MAPPPTRRLAAGWLEHHSLADQRGGDQGHHRKGGENDHDLHQGAVHPVHHRRKHDFISRLAPLWTALGLVGGPSPPDVDMDASLFDQDKMSDNDFTFLINTFDEIQCLDAVKLLRGRFYFYL